ncbi:MAG: hypothetical protein GY826_07470, partial [Fuerstiella sp.]|nr:hypothetical protein [Fuerstiella sp.]
MSRRFHAGFLFAIVTSVVLLQCAHSAEPGRRSKSATRTITQPKFDPAARKVELFAGMEVGAFATRVI